MKHIIFGIYYWYDINLIGRVARNNKGNIIYMYVNDRYFLPLIFKFYTKA